jgi:uncharacterized protein YqgC (DUF456 family)
MNMDILVMIVALGLMLLALAAVIIPVLPGLPFIWLVMLGYGYYDGWQSYGVSYILLTAVLTAAGMALDQAAGIIGAKKFGAGYPGMAGAFIGALAGLLIFNLPGLILGTFCGAFLGELIFGQSLKKSFHAGLGALLGFLVSSLSKFLIALILIGSFVFMTLLRAN